MYGIKLYCVTLNFPAWCKMAEVVSFLRPLQDFVSVSPCFYCCWGVGAIREVLICVECSPVNYSVYFAIWLPDN